MTKNNLNKNVDEDEDFANNEEEESENETPEVIIVTTKQTIDFPSLNWGIHEGEQRELPVDEAAQKIILSNANIKIVK